MKAMIFSAGLGTRFKPWTDKHPKALAIVNGKSLLQRNIEYLQSFSISDVVPLPSGEVRWGPFSSPVFVFLQPQSLLLSSNKR